jgi:uncharacterized membrane protein (GlpM family)
VLRFVGAGLLVGSLPWIAMQFGDRAAGLMLLFPVVTVSGFLVLGLERGPGAVADASAGSVAGLPLVLAFLVAVHVSARQGLSLPWIVVIGVTAWLAAASILVVLTNGSEWQR